MQYFISTKSSIGTNRFRSAAFLNRNHQVCIVMYLACFFMLFYSISSFARDWEMMLDGKSIPISRGENAVSEDIQPYFWNPYKYSSDPLIEIPMFGYHKDTLIYYHVSQLVRRFIIVEDISTVHIDLGVMGFMTNQFSSDDGSPNISIFPLVSVGIDDFALKISYSPENRDAIVNSWFVQMNVNELRFW